MGQYPPIDIDEIAQQAGLNLNSQFVIRFQQYGEDDFSGNAANDIDEFYLDNVEVYNPGLNYHDLSTSDFEDDFDTGTMKDSWAWNFADASANIVPASAITGPMNLVEVQNGVGLNNSFGVAIGRRCGNIFTTNAFDLHLNLEETSGVKMSFDIKDIADETHIDDAIYFSNDDGKSFYKAFAFDFGSLSNNVFQDYLIDVSVIAETLDLPLTDKFIIRFQQHGEDDFSGYAANDLDGIYLDNVNVFSMTTSVEEVLGKNEIELFPNPTSGFINVKNVNRLNEINSIEIVDIYGHLVWQKSKIGLFNLNHIDLRELATWIYFDSGNQRTIKLVKE